MGSKSQGTHRNDFHTTLPAELLVSIPCGPSLAPLLRLCKCCATGSPECHTVRHCTKDLVLSMPHPWRCPRPGWMGFRQSAVVSGNQPMQGVRTGWPLRSLPAQIILWFYKQYKSFLSPGLCVIPSLCSGGSETNGSSLPPDTQQSKHQMGITGSQNWKAVPYTCTFCMKRNDYSSTRKKTPL